MTPDTAAVAALQMFLRMSGMSVTVQRVSGVAPNVTVVSCAVNARVMNLTADTTQTAQAGLGTSMMGVIEQGDRTVIVSAQDLSNAGFPLPVVRGDIVILPDSSEMLNVLRVDAYTRRFCSGIVLMVVGVS
jgi:hypothetical protein